MASSTWKMLSVTLGQAAQILPPPADTAVELMAKVALLTANSLDAKDVSKENQKLVVQLSERSLMLSRMLEQYVAESRPQNDEFKAFVNSFRATMTEVVGFVEKFLQQRWMERFVNGNDVELDSADLWKRLDAHAADYRGYILQNVVSRGPSERIEHPQMREFWRNRLTNVFEAKWPHFWDQLLHDFPVARQFLSGPSASSNKAKLQARALLYGDCLVGPWQINNLFQPPQSSVENIISTVLGDQRPVKHFSVEPQDSGVKASTTETSQVQCWTGYWTQGSQQGAMTVELVVAANHRIRGGGSDEVGLFTCQGECRGTRVHFIKQYIGKHSVQYDGEIRENIMDGTWKSGSLLQSNFHLELQSCQSVANGAEARIVQVGVMQLWKGFFIQQNTKVRMIGGILFTNSNNIFGSGVDEMIGYTWLGRFQQESQYALVTMIKQYKARPAVFYMGAIGHSLATGQEELKVVMEGSWAVSDDSDHGTFFFQPNAHN